MYCTIVYHMKVPSVDTVYAQHIIVFASHAYCSLLVVADAVNFLIPPRSLDQCYSHLHLMIQILETQYCLIDRLEAYCK